MMKTNVWLITTLRDIEPEAMNNRLSTFLFYLGLGLLFTHELDAMIQSEWRLLYVLRGMPDDVAMQTFVWMHVPLFGVIAWLTHHKATPVRNWARAIFAAFLVVHAGLHLNLSEHPLYTFTSTLSRSLIYGGAAVGSFYLIVLSWRARVEL
jgi:hypothetical protein